MADIKIYGKLVNETPDGVLAGAEQVYDTSLANNQQAINAQMRNLAAEMDIADIDLGDFDRVAFARDGTGAAFYKVTHEGKPIGTLQMFGDGAPHVVTQIFTTNWVLDDGEFKNGAHNHEHIHIYRRYSLLSNSAPWYAWEEQVSTELGDNDHVAISQKAVTDALNTLAVDVHPLVEVASEEALEALIASGSIDSNTIYYIPES